MQTHVPVSRAAHLAAQPRLHLPWLSAHSSNCTTQHTHACLAPRMQPTNPTWMVTCTPHCSFFRAPIAATRCRPSNSCPGFRNAHGGGGSSRPCGSKCHKGRLTGTAGTRAEQACKPCQRRRVARAAQVRSSMRAPPARARTVLGRASAASSSCSGSSCAVSAASMSSTSRRDSSAVCCRRGVHAKSQLPPAPTERAVPRTEVTHVAVGMICEALSGRTCKPGQNSISLRLRLTTARSACSRPGGGLTSRLYRPTAVWNVMTCWGSRPLAAAAVCGPSLLRAGHARRTAMR